jgi:hypothetical protein
MWPLHARLIVGGVVVGAWGAYRQDGTWMVIGACSLIAGVIELWRARRR